MKKILQTVALAAAVAGGSVALPASAQAAPGAASSQGAADRAPARPRALSQSETRRLAQRQEKARDLEKYEGGQVVIALSTVGAIVLALIIILLIL